MLGVVDETDNAASYDVDAGTLSWQAPVGAQVVAVGTDHVVVGDGLRVQLVRWR